MQTLLEKFRAGQKFKHGIKSMSWLSQKLKERPILNLFVFAKYHVINFHMTEVTLRWFGYGFQIKF